METDIQIKPKHKAFPSYKSTNLSTLFKQAKESHGTPFTTGYYIILIFTFVVLLEFFVGLGIRSFQLVIDSLHNILNIMALCFSLMATMFSKIPKNKRFTYGYSRLEMTASFTMCCFLLFLSIFILFRGVHESLESLETENHAHSHPSGPHKPDLIIVFSIIRLGVSLIGFFAFKEFSSLYNNPASLSTNSFFAKFLNKFNKNNDESFEYNSPIAISDSPRQRTSGPSAHHANFHSIYIHFVIGIVIAGTATSMHYVKLFSDIKILFALGLLIYTIIKTKPVLTLASDILLQGLPESHEKEIDQLLSDVSNIGGIVKIEGVRYWALSPDHFTIYLDLKLESVDIKPQIESQATEILQEYFSEIVINVKFD